MTGDAPPWAQLAFSFRVRNEKRILLARAPIKSKGRLKNLDLLLKSEQTLPHSKTLSHSGWGGAFLAQAELYSEWGRSQTEHNELHSDCARALVGLLAYSIFLVGVFFSGPVLAKKLDLSVFAPETKEQLFKTFPVLSKEDWTQADLDELIQHLVRVEEYDSARVVKEDSGVYRISVGKVRRVNKLDFQGISAFSESELRRETGLGEKQPFDPGTMIEAGEKIRQMYESLGYPKTQIDIDYTDAKRADVGVTIKITEGPRTLIQDLQFKSPNPVLRDLLKSKLKSYLKDPLTEKNLAELRQKAREVLSDNGFWKTDLNNLQVDRNIDESAATLIFNLQNHDQYLLETDGRKNISLSDFEDFLNLESYTTTNPNLAGELATKVRALYLSRGFARVEVEGFDQEGPRPFVRKIRVKIQEGPLVEIEKIEITGTLSLPEKFYVTFLTEHSSSEIRKGHYVKDDLDVGITNLVTDRWNQGFLRAKLVATRSVFNKDKDRVRVSIQLDEGPLTVVDKITFRGNHKKSNEELLTVLNLKEKEPLRLNQLEKGLAELKTHYRNDGFLEMQLINEKEGLVNYNEDNTLVHLTPEVLEGPQVRVASIIIEGNSISKDEVILRELEFKRGDILTPDKIEESTARLQRLGLFSSVEIRTLEEKTQISDRTIIVRAIDRDPGLFNLGIGVSNERGFTVRGYSGVAYRNLMGTGRGVSARLDGKYNVTDIKYLERKLTLGYLEPALFDSRVRGRINLTRAVSVSDFDKRQAAEINQTTYTLEQDITSHLSVIWDAWSLATVRDFYIDGNQEISLLNIASTALTLDLDYRDHPFNPTKGTLTRLDTEYGSPVLGSTDTIEYTRSQGAFSHYLTVLDKPQIVWANSFRVGYIKNLSSLSNGAVPYDKKGFLLGGQGSIRGFTPDDAFPNSKDFGTDRYNLTTAATMHLYKTELRFPIWGTFGGALFYDGGQILIQDHNLDIGWRDAIGIALRYNTPVGPVSLEYGWKIKPRGDRSENPSVFHISVGSF